MEVGATTNDYQYQPGGTSRNPVQELDKNAFLQLFVAQLKYQDPTSPQDSSQFMAQLAQFSMLEQLANINEEIAQLRLAQEMSQASALIGRRVNILAGGTELSGQVEKVTLTGDEVQIYVNGTGYGLEQVTEVL